MTTQTLTETFSFPGYLSVSAIDQILDQAASAYVATEDGDHGALIADEQNHSLIALALATSLHDDEKINQTIIITDTERTLAWEGQIEDMTDLRSLTYIGSRRKQRLADEKPQVLITTHETLRPELMVRKASPGKRSSGAWVLGPGYESLCGPTTLWVFDGVRKVSDRGSENHHAYSHLFDALVGDRFVGLVRDPLAVDESLYNLGRLFTPGRMPSVAAFEADYCRGRNLTFRKDRSDALLKLFGTDLIRSPEPEGFVHD